VASELVRRGYTVAFTMGNHTPVADLMVGAPSDRQFWIDVKGLAGRNDWLVRNKANRIDLYYVLVSLSKLAQHNEIRRPDRFFVLTQAETNDLACQYQEMHSNNRNTIPGFGWHDPEQFEDAWEKLPR
jgi:hypothetical protein